MWQTLLIHVKRGHILRTSCNKWGHHTTHVRAFYAFESFLFYSHYSREGDAIIIPSTMGICQSDPLRNALFALAHFRALHFIASHFPFYLFSSIINNTHIIGPPSIISFAYENFEIKFYAMGLFIQP
jgi:hypothetical protein